MLYRLAHPKELLPGEDFRREYVLSATVTICTRAFLNGTIRKAFDRRATDHYVSIWHEPTDGGRPQIYEGAKLSSWTSGPDMPHRVGITISQACFVVPVDEIWQFFVDWHGTKKVAAGH